MTQGSPEISRGLSRPAQCFLAAVTLLVAIGLLTVYSASFFRADTRWGDPLFYVARQSQGLVLGLAALWIAVRVRPTFWLRLAPWLIALCVVLLAALFVVADARLGARRWLTVPGLGASFQPSELVKIAFPLFLAWGIWKFPRLHLTKRFLRRSGADDAARATWRGERGRRVLLRATQLAVLGLLVGLIAIEPDLGTAAFILAVGTLLLVVTGLPWAYFVTLALLVVPVGYVAVKDRNPEEIRQRFDGVLAPERVPQVWNGLLSIGSGGVWGRGVGNAHGKDLFIPEEYNDFVFAVYAEETGFIGVVVLLGLFSVLLQAGWRIARDCPHPALRVLGLGLTLNLVIQAIINLMVTTAMAPTKGIGLPFISYGSTSLSVALLQVGIVLGISRVVRWDSAVPAPAAPTTKRPAAASSSPRPIEAASTRTLDPAWAEGELA